MALSALATLTPDELRRMMLDYLRREEPLYIPTHDYLRASFNRYRYASVDVAGARDPLKYNVGSAKYVRLH
jgi:hypothetical protein